MSNFVLKKCYNCVNLTCNSILKKKFYNQECHRQCLVSRENNPNENKKNKFALSYFVKT